LPADGRTHKRTHRIEFNVRMGRWICGCGWKSEPISRKRKVPHARDSNSMATLPASPLSEAMNLPHFRDGSNERCCGTCRHYADVSTEVGYCRLYDRPMFSKELCDSWSVEEEPTKQ
jgi:hypothetical protein